MPKAPRFLLAKGQSSQSDFEFIVHCRHPYGVVRLRRFASTEALDDYVNTLPMGIYTRQNNTATLLEWYDSFGQEHPAPELFKIVRHASNWYYHSQLKPPE